jgi:hypothetical protein
MEKMVRQGVALLVLALLLASCATVDSGPASPDTTAAPATTATEVTTTDATDATRPGVADLPENSKPTDLMRDLTPRNGKAVFLGVANRLQNRDEERSEAIRHIAQQASRFVRIRAQYQFISERNTSSIGYLDNINTTWDTDFAEGLAESVDVLYELQDRDGTYVLGQVEGIPAPPSIARPAYTAAGEPTWINAPPSIPGYHTTVGITTPSRRFRDSVDRADEAALKGLLLQTGTTAIRVRTFDRRPHSGNGRSSDRFGRLCGDRTESTTGIHRSCQ